MARVAPSACTAAAMTVLALAASAPAAAQEGAETSLEAPPPAPLPAVPEPPDIPPPVESGKALEPEVTIRREGTRTITEYRVNGILRAVKVQNEGTPDYYLVDTDGDGRLDSRSSRWAENMLIPQWTLFRW